MVLIQSNKKILEVTLNRPDVHNAFNPEMISKLTSIFTDINEIKKHRLVLLSANGESFCSGADLNWMKSMVDFSFDQNLEDAQKLFSMFEAIKNCPIPVFANVFGNVFGGGLGLVAASDVVIAEEKTKFCFSEAKLGLLPAVISPFVKRKMNPAAMREVFFTAEVFSSEQASQWGLVNFFGTKEEIAVFFEEKKKGVLASAPEAVTLSKQLLNDLEKWSWETSQLETPKIIAKKRIEPEAQDGIRAFLEKRKPKWI